MTAEADDVLTLTAAVPDTRIAAANRFKALVRQYGPDCHRTAGTFGFQLRQDLAKYPDEANALSEALKLRATDELVRLRGTADPKTYLPTLAEALANQTGLPRDLASWALFTWHDALDVAPKGPTQVELSNGTNVRKMWVKRQPPPATTVLVTAVCVGFAALLTGGLAECVNIKFSGPTILETIIAERSDPAAKGIPIEDRAWKRPSDERLPKLAAAGFVLVGGTAGFAAFFGWSLGGGTWRRLPKGLLLAAGMSGVGTVAVVTTMNIAAVAVILSSPVLGTLLHLGLMSVMVFGVSYRVAINDRTEEDVLDMVVCGILGGATTDAEIDGTLFDGIGFD